eukprot:COSAG01_NODE_2929_length_6838_cov_12.819855_2_plen_218_part_00
MDAATFVAQGRSVAAATSDLPRPWRWVDVGASGYLSQSFEWMPDIEASEAAHAPSRAEEQEQEEDGEGLLAESGASLDVEAELGDAQSLCAPGAASGGVGALRSEVHAVLSPVYSQPLLLFSLAEARTGAPVPYARVEGLVAAWLHGRSREDVARGAPPVSQQEHPLLGAAAGVHSIGRPRRPELFLSGSQPRPADGGGGDAQGRPGTRCTAARRRR